MIAIMLIAIAAGSASALMFASVISGAMIALLLFYLAPLPLMVAAIGWGPLSAGIGGIAAATVLGAIFGPTYGIGFAVTVALPAWWLGHLALLGRPAGGGSASGNGAAPVAPTLEWYPVGRILLWIAGFAALTTMAALLTFGTNAETITTELRQGLLKMVGQDDAAASDPLVQAINAAATLAPAAASSFATLTLTFNLWLAAKITAISGRLHRPWPDLRTVELPRMTLAILGIAITSCFAGGIAAMLAFIVTATLSTAYGLTGFAVLHTLTLGLNNRAIWLGFLYAILMVVVRVLVVWPIVALVVLGLADAMFGFRRRYLRSRPPPLPVS